MRRGVIVCMLGTAVGAAPAAARVPADQKPVVSIPFRVEGRGAVATLDELWNNSDIVAEGLIDAETPPLMVYGTTPVVYTKYSVRLLEVFRRSAAVPPATTLIPVRRRGGLRDVGDRIENHVPDRYPMLKVRERYVLFLRQREWSTATPDPGIYYNETTSGPDSTFQIVDGKVTTSGVGRLSRALALLSADDLRAQLRAQARER